MTLRGRMIWLPGLTGAGVLLLMYLAIFIYDLEFSIVAALGMGNARLLVSVWVPIMAGAIGAFLAWRKGAGRFERIMASLLPVTANIVWDFAFRSERVWLGRDVHFTAYSVVHGALYAVWAYSGFLLIGAALFLLPRERTQQPRGA